MKTIYKKVKNTRNRRFYKNYQDLKNIIEKNKLPVDLELIDKAYTIACAAHQGQIRQSGVSYILHPVSVAYMLAEMNMDTESIVAAILHDVVEDTEIPLKYIEREFGQTIACLVSGLTKLSKVSIYTREERQAENLRRMLMAMAQDIRVIIIKLVDRLHNMRTIGCLRQQKRRDISLENMEVFAPIAHRLGISAIKDELEDLSLKQLDPVAYKEIKFSINEQKKDNQELIKIAKERLEKKLKDNIKGFCLQGRLKSISSIYKKMFMKNYLLEQIYDIYALRVIVKTVADCYSSLGLIHQIYTPIPNRFKDYISTPKPNLYQSLHTTVLDEQGLPFEVQIRTEEMHQTAVFGVAAHWCYKQGQADKDVLVDHHVAWIKNLVENHGESGDNLELITSIKADLVPEEVYVLTPMGKVIDLPKGSTVIDFAYAIHTEVGHHMIGAKVEKKIVPFEYKVKTGEIIEILTTKEERHGPSRDWLKIVKTSEAKHKIRQWFKKEKKVENIEEGKLFIERELLRHGIDLGKEESKVILAEIAKKHNFASLDKFFAAIGYGGFQVSRVIPKIKDKYQKAKEKAQLPEFKITEGKRYARKRASDKVVEVDGIDNCLVKFSKCCNPIPGDEIVGFVTRGFGVSIHRKDCINVPIRPESVLNCNRWVKSYWIKKECDGFFINLKIIAHLTKDILVKIVNAFSLLKLEISSFNSKIQSSSELIVFAKVGVKSCAQLENILNNLNKLKEVTCVKRI